ncbi:MAG TPA: ABC transporter permease [Candidatus Sulfotelmatobacter sp.]
MKILPYLQSLRAKFLHSSELSQEMEEELRAHIALRADDLERSGLNREEAQRRARIEFGGQEKIKDECHAALGGNLIETAIQDVRITLRGLRKSPGFAFAAILTLALAIGANTVVFSIMNAFIIRPLNVPHAESLYGLWRLEDDMSESYLDYVDLRDRNHSFEALIAYNVNEVALDTGNNPSRSWIEEASGNFFDGLNVQPYLGRFFHASDEHGPNSAPYVVLTYKYWHTHFHDDRGVIGQNVLLNKHPYTVIGVAPPGFHGTLLFFHPDFFVPIVNHDIDGGTELNDRRRHWVFMTMGHLKAGVTPGQAVADLNSIGQDLLRKYPKDEGKMTFKLVQPSMYGDYIGAPVREFLTGLMLLATLILLAACANLGSLFAARAADRSREVALRLALGSSRKRILRGLFTEAVLISLAGGAVGLAGSIFLLRQLSEWQPFPRFPGYLAVTPDSNVYLLALLLALASGVLFGAVPVRQVLQTNPYEVVKTGSSGRIRRRITARDVLLVVQIALCAVLVTSSLVAVRGLAHCLRSNFGFDLSTMLAQTDPPMAGYTADRIPPLQKRMVDALKAIPGVESVGLADHLPLSEGSIYSNVFADSTSDLRPSKAAMNPVVFKVSPEYFQAAGTSLLSGRSFSWHDDKGSPPVAVVNGQFARRMFGSIQKGQGSYFKMPDGTRTQVVGIAEDGKYDRITESPRPAMYLPILQSPSSSSWMVMRSKRDPQQLGGAIRSALREVDAALPVYIQTRYNALDTALFGPRMATLALGVLGGMGAILSVVGIFGMAAYSVSKRLRELGIRVALGGQRKEVLQTALGRAFKLLAYGSAAGLVLGILASRVLAFIVAQATPRDPLVLAGVVFAMALLGLLATWIPARRALSIDPLRLLRED